VVGIPLTWVRRVTTDVPQTLGSDGPGCFGLQLKVHRARPHLAPHVFSPPPSPLPLACDAPPSLRVVLSSLFQGCLLAPCCMVVSGVACILFVARVCAEVVRDNSRATFLPPSPLILCGGPSKQQQQQQQHHHQQQAGRHNSALPSIPAPRLPRVDRCLCDGTGTDHAPAGEGRDCRRKLTTTTLDTTQIVSRMCGGAWQGEGEVTGQCRTRAVRRKNLSWK
jgi:hypothetical protein